MIAVPLPDADWLAISRYSAIAERYKALCSCPEWGMPTYEIEEKRKLEAVMSGWVSFADVFQRSKIAEIAAYFEKGDEKPC